MDAAATWSCHAKPHRLSIATTCTSSHDSTAATSPSSTPSTIEHITYERVETNAQNPRAAVALETP
jgi:hypothetical protein